VGRKGGGRGWIKQEGTHTKSPAAKEEDGRASERKLSLYRQRGNHKGPYKRDDGGKRKRVGGMEKGKDE